MLNEDYKDMLLCLLAERVEFLLVGAYALAAHGYPRATLDIDLWVRPSAENAEAVLKALRRFGAPLHGLSREDLQRHDTIYQIGVAPRRIDIITGASGLEFDAVYERSLKTDWEGVAVRIPRMEDLIVNKRASGRAKDLADAETLEGFLAPKAGKETSRKRRMP